ncbi:hypothetical protein DL766_000451 [Monosporascus sp. MC13-8B]|uniref:Palmitoyl-protein thioesterase 1 n=1 Tax=Monosporascus cannonballus TaxID=155416 RepID=A0ABY0HA39_9PEZI|nr:hypothetical protein DL762_005216 [Monosporascus cannonballus]RYP00202.1 hypothetical protein DL763_000971 [Monosporascus cannonballus]RYP39299.1 hypothetical protein DL766_000451 [Monosporascus sp. MC13-8B]
MPSLRKLPIVVALASTILSAAASPAVAQPQPQQPITSTTMTAAADGDGNDDTPLPLVIWHGLADDFQAEGLRSVGRLAEAAHPGIFVYYVRLDATASGDRSATFYGNVTEQLAGVCAELAAHPILSTAPAVDALGLSQGGQFLRGYVERCNAPPVRSLVTVGSQHNGIVDYRSCGAADLLCRGAMALLHGQTWSRWVQGRLVPAQYFRDPADMGSYLAHSNFLADINNERERKNATYAANVARLANFVMHMFEDDTTVVPKETGWFQEVNGTEVTPLRARKIYEEDWIGLKELDRKGGLHFISNPGNHMEIPDELLMDIFAKYLGPYSKEFPRESEGPSEL